MKETKKRITYIDIARALAIFFVIMGHSSSGYIHKMIYSFHMPLFFIISGMLLRHRSSDFSIADLGKTLVKRFSAYYIPYMIWALFYSALTLKNVLKIMYGTREVLVQTDSLSSLWFLPVLFLASVFAEIVMWIAGKTRSPYVFSAAAMAALFAAGFAMPHIEPYGWPMGADIAFVAAGFMMLGFMIRKLSDGLKERPFWMTAVVTAVFLAAVILIPYNLLPPGRVSMYRGLYTNIPVFLLNAILQSCLAICLALLLDRVKVINTALVYTGQNTLGIFVLHKPFVKWLHGVAKEHGYAADSIGTVLGIAAAGLIVSLCINEVLGRIAPYLVGKKKN